MPHSWASQSSATRSRVLKACTAYRWLPAAAAASQAATAEVVGPVVMKPLQPGSLIRAPFGMTASARSATTAPIPPPSSGRGTSSRASQPGRCRAASSRPSYRQNLSMAGSICSTVAVSCPSSAGSQPGSAAGGISEYAFITPSRLVAR